MSTFGAFRALPRAPLPVGDGAGAAVFELDLHRDADLAAKRRTADSSGAS